MTGLQEDLEKARAALSGGKENEKDGNRVKDCIEHLEKSRTAEFCEGESPVAIEQGKEKLQRYVEYLEEVRAQELIAGELGSHLRNIEMRIKTHLEDLVEVHKKERELGLSDEEKKELTRKRARLEKSIKQYVIVGSEDGNGRAMVKRRESKMRGAI